MSIFGSSMGKKPHKSTVIDALEQMRAYEQQMQALSAAQTSGPTQPRAPTHPHEYPARNPYAINPADIIRNNLAGNANLEFTVYFENWSSGEAGIILIRIHNKTSKTVITLEDPTDKFPSIDLLSKLQLLR